MAKMRLSPYVCPHCGARQYVAPGKGFAAESEYRDLEISGTVRLPGGDHSTASLGTRASITVCSQCLAPSIELDVVLKQKSFIATAAGGGRTVRMPGGVLASYYKGRVYPPAIAPNVHPAVPQPLAEDYKEAWAIVTLSPKSSAVLARRCIQGAIRDFCGIARGTLNVEIDELERRYRNGDLGDISPYVTHELLQAVDDIRSIGNIGAHMQKNINKLIPVDPDEAKLLLDLVGTLFAEWYQAKFERQERIARLARVAAEKGVARESKR